MAVNFGIPGFRSPGGGGGGGVGHDRFYRDAADRGWDVASRNFSDFNLNVPTFSDGSFTEPPRHDHSRGPYRFRLSDVPLRSNETMAPDHSIMGARLTSSKACEYNWAVLRSLYSIQFPNGATIPMFVNDTSLGRCVFADVLCDTSSVVQYVNNYATYRVDGNSNQDYYKFQDLLDRHLGKSRQGSEKDHLLWDDLCNTFRLKDDKYFKAPGDLRAYWDSEDGIVVLKDGVPIFEGPLWELSDRPESLVELLRGLGVRVSDPPISPDEPEETVGF